MEVPAPFAGVVKEMKASSDKIAQGTLIPTLEAEEGGGPAQASASAPASAPLPLPCRPRCCVRRCLLEHHRAGGRGRLYSCPRQSAVRRARTGRRSIKLSSGPKARILKDDVQSFKTRHRALHRQLRLAVSGSRYWPCRRSTSPSLARSRLPLSRIKKISGANLHRNWVSIPHVTQNDEVDITELEAFRKQMSRTLKQGVKPRRWRSDEGMRRGAEEIPAVQRISFTRG